MGSHKGLFLSQSSGGLKPPAGTKSPQEHRATCSEGCRQWRSLGGAVGWLPKALSLSPAGAAEPALSPHLT